MWWREKGKRLVSESEKGRKWAVSEKQRMEEVRGNDRRKGVVSEREREAVGGKERGKGSGQQARKKEGRQGGRGIGGELSSPSRRQAARCRLPQRK